MPSALSQSPQGFNYQALARDASKNPITVPLDVRFTVRADSVTGTVFWVEEHYGVQPNEFGVFNVVVGRGTRISGLAKFSDVDFTVTPKYLMTEINHGGWKFLGSSRLWSVPYALVADSLGGPLKKLSVKGITTNMEEPLFEVKNKDGKTVFAVYNEGVRAYVADGDAKGLKGGFAVSSMADTKNGDMNYLYISGDSIRAYVFDDPTGKAVKGGFAVSGYNYSKKQTNDYLLVSPDSIRAYIASSEGKASKGGFAVGGFDSAKEVEGEEYLRITRDSARIYVKEPLKGSKGGFAVGSFVPGKGGLVSQFTSLEPQNYFIGHRSGMSNSIGIHNSFVGYETGIKNTSGSKNIFLGYKSGYNNDTASCNVFIGNEAGLMNRFGRYNTFMGYQAGYNNNDSYSTYIGYSAGYSSTTGRFNIFMGWTAGQSNTVGDNNVFIGSASGNNNSSGGNNVFIGNRSGFSNNTGNYNVHIGYASGDSTDANYNVFVGNSAGRKTKNGHSNVFIGNGAGAGNISGYGNIFIGRDAGAFQNDTAKLYIDYGPNSKPLIYGNLLEDSVRVNGTFETTGNVVLNQSLYFTNGIELNNYGIGNRTSYLDFHGDNSWSDYALRIRRSNEGSDANSEIKHRGTGNLVILSEDNGSVVFGTSNTERIRINSSGNVGIGTSIPSYKLTVNGTAWCSSGSWTGSDIRWKKNISEISDILPLLENLQPVKYELRKDEFPDMGFEMGDQIGLIAQDVEKVFPELVRTDHEGYKSVAYDKFTAVLLAAIKEQQSLIEVQEQENIKIKSQLEDLKKQITMVESLLKNK
jgi:hypothetical protein